MEKIWENSPGTVCFQDDLLVERATEEAALRRLDQTLKRLRSWKLVLKQTKCKFLMPSVQYLGVEVSVAGVQTVKEKVDPGATRATTARHGRAEKLPRSSHVLCKIHTRHVISGRAPKQATAKEGKVAMGGY